MSPRQPTPETEEPATDKESDDRGIVYHGDEWDEETAEGEGERGMVTNTDDDIVVDEEDDIEGHHDERQSPDDDVK